MSSAVTCKSPKNRNKQICFNLVFKSAPFYLPFRSVSTADLLIYRRSMALSSGHLWSDDRGAGGGVALLVAGSSDDAVAAGSRSCLCSGRCRLGRGWQWAPLRQAATGGGFVGAVCLSFFLAGCRSAALLSVAVGRLLREEKEPQPRGELEVWSVQS